MVLIFIAAEYYPIVYMDHILIIPLSAEGLLGCYHFLAIANMILCAAGGQALWKYAKEWYSWPMW